MRLDESENNPRRKFNQVNNSAVRLYARPLAHALAPRSGRRPLRYARPSYLAGELFPRL